MTNRKAYDKFLETFKRDDCKLPEAAAFTSLIEKSIREKTYVIYEYNEDHSGIDEFDVIVTFNVSGDPRFGFLREDDGERVIMFPTGEGLKQVYL